MEESQTGDICRVCRSEGTPDRPLFHPCICTGSIKWIHQECLVQWMRYSHKEYCELCGYRFSFMPIYSPDMPRRLPIRDVAGGLISSIMTAVKYWIHYTLVAIAWLGIVPLTACRVYRCLFNGSVDSVLTLPLDILSTENIGSDIFHGCFVVTCTLFAFIGLVWLREQILHGGGPDWLEREDGAPGWQQGGGALGGPQGQPVPPPGNNNLVEPQLNEEVVEANGGGAAVEGGGVAAGGDWNPLEWERAAEELTWERLLGLDGSLVFLEHVFWVVSLNTLFILVFAFCPYHMGQFAVSALGIKHHVTASHFQGLVTTLCGYCVIGICLVCLHSLAALFSLVKSRRILGHCYVVVKVSLLSVVEIGVLPLICGWWLDICSLGLFDATLRDRQAGFRTAPGTSMFIHWLVGMVYVYYFASFILLLREVLRPGLLWFLKNLNDPDFSPIQEMIQLPMGRHARRLVASAVIFGSAVLLMLWFPVRLLRWLAPGFLPYTVSLHPDAQLNELSLELLLLQVILPALLEQSHTRSWLKAAVRYWCVAASWLLGLRSYLLGERTEEAVGGGGAAIEAQDAGPELGAAHHAMLQRAGPVGYQPYTAPPFFALRVVALILLAAASLATASLTALTVPVLLGRRVMSFYHGPKPAPSMGTPQVHELYTAAAGAYLCWLAARSLTLAYSWRGRLTETLRSWAIVAAKCLVATTLMVGVIPLLSGLLLELVVVTPVRVPFDQTPVPWLWQDWALGVLYTKIGCAITMMGPDWFLRRGLEAAYRDGVRGMVLRRVVFDVALPVIKFLALTLAVPYVVAHSITPLFVKSATLRLIIARRIYPTVLIAAMIAFLIYFQVRQFSRLYEHIKNDKYLVGRRLVNYHHNKNPPPPSSQSVQTT